MTAVSSRCGHWSGATRSYCGSELGIRAYKPGPRCPLHTPAAVAGRPEPPAQPRDVPYLTPTIRKAQAS
jgi:hypothetical protein